MGKPRSASPLKGKTGATITEASRRRHENCGPPGQGAAAVDGASLSKPKSICFGGWNFYRSKPLSGLLNADDIDDKIRTARKCAINEIFFSAPDRLFDSLKEKGEDIRRLDEEDSLPETIAPYRMAFQQA